MCSDLGTHLPSNISGKSGDEMLDGKEKLEYRRRACFVRLVEHSDGERMMEKGQFSL
jgi:hypothetical protein